MGRDYDVRVGAGLTSGDQYDVRVGSGLDELVAQAKSWAAPDDMLVKAAIRVGVDKGQPGGDMTAVTTMKDGVVTSVEFTEEAPKRRGRPKKVEPAPEPGATEAQEEPGLPFDQTSIATSAPASLEETSQNTPTSAEPTGEPENVSTFAPAHSPTTDPEITDSELQRYCAKLAQHFGTPQTVFDLAGKFVPEGAVARPTNIRDNSPRWAFVRAAEEQSGVKYHG